MRVKVKRECGPYLNKNQPNLKVGEYEAEHGATFVEYSEDNSKISGEYAIYVIHENGFDYKVLPEDVEVL